MPLAMTRRHALAGLAGLPLLGLSPTRAAAVAAAPPPEGYDTYLVYLMNGVVDADAETLLPKGDTFQREIMRRTAEEVDAELERAEQFFADKFGLDFTGVEAVDGVKTIDNITLDTLGFMLDPERQYRVYTISDRKVPTEGWLVRDGGWAVMIGEGGATLRGEWGGEDGTKVPAKSFMVFGDYNIDADGEEIPIHYQSGSPILPPGPNGLQVFSCDLTHREWGDGLANGIILPPQKRGDGTIKTAIRNVLTFPGY